MKKMGKAIIVVIVFYFVISIASTTYLLKNSNFVSDFSDAVDNYNEQISNMMGEQTSFDSNENYTDLADSISPKDESKITTNKIEDTVSDDELTLDAFIDKPLVEFIEKIEQLDYEAVYLAEGVDFTEFIKDVADLYLTSQIKLDTANKKVTVEIVSASKHKYEIQKEELEEKLPLYKSWTAVEEHGKETYYDFELNYISGKIAEELENENTWFLKATCKVLGVEKICEAKVTGDEKNPDIIYFVIY